MTLRQPNYDRMLQLGLHGMAEAIEEQYHLPGVEELGFDDGSDSSMASLMKSMQR